MRDDLASCPCALRHLPMETDHTVWANVVPAISWPAVGAWIRASSMNGRAFARTVQEAHT
jgi:hypothetical protein